MRPILALLALALPAVLGCTPPDCARPDHGSCGGSCCALSWSLDSTPEDVFKQLYNMTHDGGPDGRFRFVAEDIVEDLPYLLKATHATASAKYIDEIRIGVNQGPSGSGSLVTAFSLSTTVNAYGDAGQNYKNLALVASTLQGVVQETTLYGCPIAADTMRMAAK